jgi:hypothetical protein
VPVGDAPAGEGEHAMSGRRTDDDIAAEVEMAGSLFAVSRVDRVDDEVVTRDQGSAGAPRYSRRLSDKILIAFHHACDQGDFEVADQLLHILEMMLTRRPLTPDGTRRRNMESLVAAHERLWYLRHPVSNDD